MSLTSEQRQSRLAFDWSVLQRMRGPVLRYLHAYRSADAVRAGRPLHAADAEAGLFEYVAATLRFPMPTSATTVTDEALVLFAVTAGGDYPFSKPLVWIISKPVPWTPHIHPANGSVCQGSIWEQGRGRMLLGQLLVHVARLLNFDEPNSGSDGGYVPEAGWFARDRLGGKPFNPGLQYPQLPADLCHGQADTQDDGFIPVVRSAASQAFFAPVHSAQADTFRAIGVRR